MNGFVDPTRLNLARPNRRHPPISWVLLALGALLCALSVYHLQHSIKALDEVSMRQREFSQASKRRTESTRKAKLLENSPPMLERDKAQRQLQEFAHMSWDGLFDALEVAADVVRSGVSIVVLVPSKIQPSSIELTLTALASNPPVMLAYLKALKTDPRVMQVELTSQQPDEKSGPGVVRFQFNLVCDPKVVVAHPPRPPYTPITPSAPAVVQARPGMIVPPAVLNSATVPALLQTRKP